MVSFGVKSLRRGDFCPSTVDQVAYIGLFLTGRALKWFKPYLTKIQINGIMSTNLEVKYMFLSWGGFAEQLM